jgi:hypothetical protein
MIKDQLSYKKLLRDIKFSVLLASFYQEIYDFRMKHSAISGQKSAKAVGIMRFLLKAESYMLIALIRKWVFPDER